MKTDTKKKLKPLTPTETLQILHKQKQVIYLKTS